MAKRSSGTFKRVKGDFYRTWDPKMVRPLLPHLEHGTRFVEPCAGDGVMVDHLRAAGHRCVYASDISPGRADVIERDAMDGWSDITDARVEFITNPPWSRPLLHAMIPHLAAHRPLWALFDADWAHTDQAAGRKAVAGVKRDLMAICHKIVSVGRVKWFEGSQHDGKDNAAWYLFDARVLRFSDGPIFINRRMK